MTARLLHRRSTLIAGVVAATLVVAIPTTVVAVTKFTDVPSTSPYYKDIQAAYSAGVVGRCAPKKFCPKKGATRQELARLANKLGALSPGARPVVRAATAVTATTAANATNAANLDGLDSTAFVRNTGQIRVQAAPSAWRTFYTTSTLTATNFSSLTQWTRPTAGSEFLMVQPDLSPVLYGRSLALSGVELCYEAGTGNTLTYVEINTQGSTTGAGTRSLTFSDPTSRTDTACRLYSLPAPITLSGDRSANLFIQVAFGANPFSISRTSFVLIPTAVTAAAAAPVAVTELTRGGNGLTSPK